MPRSCRSRIATLSSSEPPSTTTYSTSASCETTERIADSRNCPWFRLGVTIEITSRPPLDVGCRSRDQTAEVTPAKVPPCEQQPVDVRMRTRKVVVEVERRAQPCAVRPRRPPRLRPERLGLRHRLRLRMEPVAGEHAVDVAHLEARAELQPELIVHRVTVRLVDSAHGVERGTSEERAGLRNAVSHLELEGVIERDRRHLAENVPLLVDLAPAAVHERTTAGTECLHRGRHSAREVDVVRVQPAEDLAASQREPLVERMRLAAVRLRDPAKVVVAPKDVERLVRRAAVDDDVLDPRVVLLAHAVDRRRKIPALVQGRSHDRDERKLDAHRPLPARRQRKSFTSAAVRNAAQKTERPRPVNPSR